MRFLPSTALAAGIACLLAAAPAQSREGKALVIGIDRYPHVSRLDGSANDARSMRDFAIERWGFKPNDVKLLIDGEATRSAILSALDAWLVSGTKPGDTVLFFFSGHGYRVPDLNGDEALRNPADNQDEVIVAFDGRLRQGGGYEGFVLDDEIDERLKRLKDRQVVMLFDSCFSGTMTRGGGGLDDGQAKVPIFEIDDAVKSVSLSDDRGQQRIVPDLTESQGNVIAFYAAGPDQVAQVNTRLAPRRGVFTEAFLRGAAGAADANGNGIVSVAEIEDFVRREAETYCKENACKTGMTPFVEAPPDALSKDLITLAQAPTLAQAAADAIGPGPEKAVEVTVSPGRIPVGRDVSVTVKAPIDGTLVVLDIAPDEEVNLLFPNAHSEARGVKARVRAGQTIRIPDPYDGFSLPADEPPGKGTVLALVIQDDIRFEQLNQLLRAAAAGARNDGGFASVADPLRFLNALGQRLVRPWTADLTTRGVRWAMGRYEYEILRK
ncbi:caspase family protein [Azospirillum agricola]|uniref:caspase family protein n=1 Tax=Azospirillum agricola TaxID=1720247 RepID=UPI000A0F3AAD|nr:caspase family protein [Azospirillum agricola]SMH31854.1 protein of unknown function [Azospirillum lipoferum]